MAVLRKEISIPALPGLVPKGGLVITVSTQLDDRGIPSSNGVILDGGS
eukprot:CAMPEP_0204623876 /NCGR_PEP_ID=MMETSP0717-20131115/9642_1 /ASSEMBLY_ACC=CAM_ASM_000666 /TAXON_ID=230516 /ORGANISM="Chaetoceros curvisetus" /LENGTH=47 /DNA_ID= /DNA_START= /DNA_END= /DNA_ORIENTATION=